MVNEWDRDSNILTEEEEIEERHRLWAEQAEERRRRREYNERHNYIRPPGMPADEVDELFPHHVNRYSEEEREQYAFQNGVYMSYWANKLWYVCHNCGHIGWKYGRSHQLFKCYCGSRNVDLVRAAYISKALRENREGCTNMEDVYNERRERIRRQREERSARRRNTQREN
jgi:hypothetical protein